MTRLQSASIASTLDQAAMQGACSNFWDQTQSGLKYQAQEAGLGVNVSGDEGLVIRIDGFSQHQADVLARVLAFLDQPVDQTAFEQARSSSCAAWPT